MNLKYFVQKKLAEFDIYATKLFKILKELCDLLIHRPYRKAIKTIHFQMSADFAHNLKKSFAGKSQQKIFSNDRKVNGRPG